ncbi:MAG: hypothetical protein JNJ49_09550 [Bdellovibrionaceae bacterium]|nr:hypothetical protein [Pseudobdellovibrionaceae bacterium]
MRYNLRQVQSFNSIRVSPDHTILVFDRRLLQASPAFRRWAKSFPFQFAVKAGEGLKSLNSFSTFTEKVHRVVGGRANREWTVVAVGGGSVGDFAGFFASVYKRGLKLIHIPSTWLSAIDSSHGGKTALNLMGAKNQIGTFYPAEQTILVRELLLAQPTARIEDGVGELAKAAILSGGTWGKGLMRPTTKQGEWLWRNLPQAIKVKMKIVSSDPFETKGARQVLNLGHTFGHVLEAVQGLSHGAAVGQGLLFAIDVSERAGRLNEYDGMAFRNWLAMLGIEQTADPVREQDARKALLHDKKRGSGEDLIFILIEKMGRVRRQSVAVERLISIGIETGWIC